MLAPKKMTPAELAAYMQRIRKQRAKRRAAEAE